MTLMLVIAAVSVALIVGAVWGLYFPLPERLQGFLIAFGGGALIQSLMTDLIQPSARDAGLGLAVAFVLLGAVLFSYLDYLVDEVWASTGGLGLLLAITFDGVPENLALGVELIGGSWSGVAALAAAIVLSNLPEAAGGAAKMREGGLSRWSALLLWICTALLLSGAAVAGRFGLADASDETLAAVRCVAAGAIVASLATEVFPQAFRANDQLSGIAVALGLILSLILADLGGN